jgi:hypothetical protein
MFFSFLLSSQIRDIRGLLLSYRFPQIVTMHCVNVNRPHPGSCRKRPHQRVTECDE